jgi:hypothetical protein
LRVAVIRIDVHPAGENPTNTPHAYFIYYKRLNPRNYSEQELTMELFVRATGDDMNRHTKIQRVTKGRYL